MIVVLFVVTGCITPSGTWLEGKSAYDQGSYGQAISYWTDPEVKAYSPGVIGRSNYYRWLGHAYNRNGQYREAIENYKTALNANPGRLELQQECWDGIRKSYEALRADYVAKGQLNEAISLLKEATVMDPKYAPHFTNLGYLYNELNQHDEAIEAVNKAIAIKPDAISHNNIGWSYYHKRQYDEAVKHFSSAIMLDDKLSYMFAGRGWSYFFLGKFEAALKDFNRLAELIKQDDKPGMQGMMRGKAWTYLGLGDAGTAFGLMKKARDIQDYDNRYEFALMHYAIGDKEKAWEYRGGRGMIGVHSINYSKGTVKAVEVVRTTPDGPAYKAGVLKGDIIIRMNKLPIENDRDFFEKARELSPGTIATLTVLREGIEKNIELTVDSAELVMEEEELIKPFLAKKSYKPETKVAFSPASRMPADEKLPPFRSDAFAIVIGIDYSGRQDIPHLKYAAQDARRVYDVLTNPIYGGVPPENAILLLNEKATRNEMMTTLRKIKNRDGYIYVYFSGHGAPKSKGKQLTDAFLVPYDVVLTDPEALEDTAIKVSYVRELVEQSTAKGVLVAFDACFAGGGKSIVPQGGKPLVGMLASPELLQTKGTGKVVVTSSAMNEQSWEDEKELRSGIFSHYFLEALKGKAGGDAWVKVDELSGYIKENVQKAARKLKGVEQTPQVSGSADFPVTRNWERSKALDIETARGKLKSAFERGSINAAQLSKALDELKMQKRSKTLEAFLEGKIEEKSFGELY